MNYPPSERGHEFVIVLEGTVDVVIDGDVVATCNAGDYFGEIALLEDRPRTATVIAKTNVVVDVIGRREFSVLLNHHPDIDERLRCDGAASHRGRGAWGRSDQRSLTTEAAWRPTSRRATARHRTSA